MGAGNPGTAWGRNSPETLHLLFNEEMPPPLPEPKMEVPEHLRYLFPAQ